MGSSGVARCGFVTLLLLPGCPGDDIAADGETGETGDPGSDPVDPLDGDGSVPPGRPNPEDRWVAPSTLGNGLVHDTRSKVDPSIHAAPFTSDQLAAGAAWSSFVDSNTAMLARGFRPAQVDAAVELTDELEVLDDTLYISDDDANYRTEIFTHVFSTLAAERAFDAWEPVALGARPTSIQPFAGDGHVGYSVAWVYDSATITPTVPWLLKVGQSTQELTALLADPDLRPISLASRRRAGASEYAVILVPADSPASWPASIHVQTSSLASEIADRWQDGFYPLRITAEQGDSTHVDVLWAMRPPGISVQTRVNLTDAAFEEADGWWRSHGYHLETTDEYVQGGQARRVGVWVRYEPHLRWKGSKFVPGDTAYDTKYKMFHDQALRIIGNVTEIDCSGGQPCPAGDSCYACPAEYPCFHDDVCVEADFGQLTRPSATLHIFEGDDLVFNRAYTFAPSVYPDTPINASMKTGSVAKSITATAVVREMDVQGLSLNTSFAGTIGITPTYFLEVPTQPVGTLTVRVRDVLDHQGGFPGSKEVPVSYLGHADIVAAGATVPVDGQELFEYVFAPPPDGRVNLGFMHPDTYWQPEWFVMSLNGTMRYSNAGYSLVGELVRNQSGVPYDEYVTSELFTPLGLQDRIYPDPGSRVRTRGPTLVSTGDYLVDTKHPYNVSSPNPVQPGLGLAANPVQDWKSYMGPTEPRAPVRATERYGGALLPRRRASCCWRLVGRRGGARTLDPHHQPNEHAVTTGRGQVAVAPRLLELHRQSCARVGIRSRVVRPGKLGRLDGRRSRRGRANLTQPHVRRHRRLHCEWVRCPIQFHQSAHGVTKPRAGIQPDWAGLAVHTRSFLRPALHGVQSPRSRSLLRHHETSPTHPIYRLVARSVWPTSSMSVVRRRSR